MPGESENLALIKNLYYINFFVWLFLEELWTNNIFYEKSMQSILFFQSLVMRIWLLTINAD
jgi:hypothetical protein